jgi:hypothetical protein
MYAGPVKAKRMPKKAGYGPGETKRHKGLWKSGLQRRQVLRLPFIHSLDVASTQRGGQSKVEKRRREEA